jgi:hypothetical protein
LFLFFNAAGPSAAAACGGAASRERRTWDVDGPTIPPLEADGAKRRMAVAAAAEETKEAMAPWGGGNGERIRCGEREGLLGLHDITIKFHFLLTTIKKLRTKI